MSPDLSIFILSAVDDIIFTLTYFLSLVHPKVFSISEPLGWWIFLLGPSSSSCILHSYLLLIQDSMQILPPHQASSFITLGVLSQSDVIKWFFFMLFLKNWRNQFLKLALLLFFCVITRFTITLLSEIWVPTNTKHCIPKACKCIW